MELIRQIESDTLMLRDLKGLLGKKVKIYIEILEEVGPNKPKPRPLGKYHLGKKLDKMNIRDFAYEEN